MNLSFNVVFHHLVYSIFLDMPNVSSPTAKRIQKVAGNLLFEHF